MAKYACIADYFDLELIISIPIIDFTYSAVVVQIIVIPKPNSSPPMHLSKIHIIFCNWLRH